MRSQLRNMTSLAGLVAVAVIVAAGAAKASTITLFSNFFACASGPNCYNQTNSYGIAGPLQGDPVEAMPFTAGATANLADAILPLANFTLSSFATNPLVLDLESTGSTTGLPSGTILATFTQQGTIPSSTTGGLVTFNYTGAPVQLTQGTEYWLVALQTGGTVNGWFFSGIDFGITAFNSSGSPSPPWNVTSPFSTRSAFLVDGTTPSTAAPEAGTLELLALAMLVGSGVLGWRRAAMLLAA